MKLNKKKELKVSAIKRGTVIDHIPADALFKVIKIMELEGIKNQFTCGGNLSSKKLEQKAIIKIADKFLLNNEINKIALIAPYVKINIIENYKIIEKKKVEIPNIIKGFIKCVNPNCITNHENITSKFKVIDTQGPRLECHYCNKITDGENIVYL